MRANDINKCATVDVVQLAIVECFHEGRAMYEIVAANVMDVIEILLGEIPEVILLGGKTFGEQPGAKN